MSTNSDFFDIFSMFGGAFGNNPEMDAQTLDEYWEEKQIDKYYQRVNQLKCMGFQILRNSDGKHIVKKR